jgi:P27 family predicted phage terminase small subunit
MPGPAPRPTKLKLLTGERNLPRLNFDEPIPRDAMPVCPDTAAQAVREIWDYTVREIAAMKILAAADRDALLCYCEAVVNHRKASALLAKSEVIIKGLHGGPIRNPALAVQRDAAETIRRLAQEFGLTPSGRSRIRTMEAGGHAPAEEDNPFAVGS